LLPVHSSKFTLEWSISMREKEMHERVQEFLKVRMRAMVLPATLGLSLALGGCKEEGLESGDGGNPTISQDASLVSPVYSAAMPDARLVDALGTKPDTGIADTGPTVKYMAQLPDTGAGTDSPVYMAPLPDTGIAPEYMAQLPDTGVATKYLAQLPDAGVALRYMAQLPDTGIAVRYMAQQPDADQVVALYMARNPS
jgi:hypothetical protein